MRLTRRRQGVRILVVDDDPLQARLMKAHLEQVGDVTAEATASGTEALAILAGSGADAVLLDLLMPHVDGVELTRRIRLQHPAVPIVVTSASANVQRAVEAIRAGATEFLPKPLNVAAFLGLVAAKRHDRRPEA